jgi:hypothetical protein
VDSAAAEQIRLVQAKYEEEKSASSVETKAVSDGRYLAEAQALIGSGQQQLQILRDAMGQKLTLLNEEFRIRKEDRPSHGRDAQRGARPGRARRG